MADERIKLEQIRIPEIAQVWDDRQHEWILAYQQLYRRYEAVHFIEDVLFDSTDETKTSDSFRCAAYNKFLLLINLDVTSTPTDILIDVEFSNDNSAFFKYMRGPFGDLRYEDAAGDKKECIDGDVQAQYMRLKLTSSGCTSSKTFRMDVWAILR